MAYYTRKYNRRYRQHDLGESGARLPARVWRGIAEELGASPVWAKQYSQVVKGESGGRPGIRGHDPGGTIGRGGPQITWGVQGPVFFNYMKKHGWSEADMHNPVVATKVALWMDRNSGANPAKGPGNWGNWYGTRFLNRNLKSARSVLDGRSSAKVGKGRTTTTTTTLDTGIDVGAERQSLLFNYLQTKDQPGALLQLGLGLQNLASLEPSKTVTTTTRGRKRGGKKDDAPRDGMPREAGGHYGQIFEAFYDPAGRYYDSGQFVRGAIGGHGTHVHVSASPRYVDWLGRQAQKMGLHVGENETFDPVDPVHTDGSYHYRNRAIDVSGDAKAMSRFYRFVMKAAAHQ